VVALRAYNSPWPLSRLRDEQVDEYKLGSELIVVVGVWVLYYYVPEYNLNWHEHTIAGQVDTTVM
jgi:hypothetical protein